MPPDVVKRGDFTRALTEFWADGPKSETPPGHWNVIANRVSDELGPNLGSVAAGPTVDRLQWDVKLYLALNGAVHDAAIAAWGLKGHYDSVRPISMIRYMAALGQSSDPSLPSLRQGGPAARPGPRRADHQGDHRARPATCRAGRQRGPDRDPRLVRQPQGSQDPDQSGHLDPRCRLGALPAPDLRHAVVPGLHLRPQHVQPGRRRGDDRVHRQRIRPGRSRRGHDRSGLAQGRVRSDRAGHASNGRPTTTRPTWPGSPACSAASTSRPTTSTVAQTGSLCGTAAGRSPSGITPGRSSDRGR